MSLTNLKGLQARFNSNLDISDDTVLQKIAKLSAKFLDDMYSTRLSLANIGSEVWFGTDADDSIMEILITKPQDELNKIVKFEIPNNKEITDSSLQILLKKLTNLELLQADGSNLASFDFIEENSKLRYISVLNTTIKNLTNLEKCKSLGGLRINTADLDLKQYSKLVSDICSRGCFGEIGLRCGILVIGGINTSASILNTLNGTKEKPNMDFTCFNTYIGGNINWGKQKVDFSNTGLTTIKCSLYDNIEVKLPSCFKELEASTCGLASLDYSNLVDSDVYDANYITSLNCDSFYGYKTVKTYRGTPIDIVGSHTLSLSLGNSSSRKYSSPSEAFDIQSIVNKAGNVTNMTVCGADGLSDLTILSSLSLTDLYVQYSSIYKLKSAETEFEKIGESLTTLKITDCNTFSDLDGLDRLKNIKLLDLTNDVSLENIQMITKNGIKEAMDTCKYIVTSLPKLETIKLKGSGISDYKALIENGFYETFDGSREFVKNN